MKTFFPIDTNMSVRKNENFRTSENIIKGIPSIRKSSEINPRNNTPKTLIKEESKIIRRRTSQSIQHESINTISDCRELEYILERCLCKDQQIETRHIFMDENKEDSPFFNSVAKVECNIPVQIKTILESNRDEDVLGGIWTVINCAYFVHNSSLIIYNYKDNAIMKEMGPLPSKIVAILLINEGILHDPKMFYEDKYYIMISTQDSILFFLLKTTPIFDVEEDPVYSLKVNETVTSLAQSINGRIFSGNIIGEIVEFSLENRFALFSSSKILKAFYRDYSILSSLIPNFLQDKNKIVKSIQIDNSRQYLYAIIINPGRIKEKVCINVFYLGEKADEFFKSCSITITTIIENTRKLHKYMNTVFDENCEIASFNYVPKSVSENIYFVIITSTLHIFYCSLFIPNVNKRNNVTFQIISLHYVSENSIFRANPRQYENANNTEEEIYNPYSFESIHSLVNIESKVQIFGKVLENYTSISVIDSISRYEDSEDYNNIHNISFKMNKILLLQEEKFLGFYSGKNEEEIRTLLDFFGNQRNNYRNHKYLRKIPDKDRTQPLSFSKVHTRNLYFDDPVEYVLTTQRIYKLEHISPINYIAEVLIQERKEFIMEKLLGKINLFEIYPFIIQILCNESKVKYKVHLKKFNENLSLVTNENPYDLVNLDQSALTNARYILTQMNLLFFCFKPSQEKFEKALTEFFIGKNESLSANKEIVHQNKIILRSAEVTSLVTYLGRILRPIWNSPLMHCYGIEDKVYSYQMPWITESQKSLIRQKLVDFLGFLSKYVLELTSFVPDIQKTEEIKTLGRKYLGNEEINFSNLSNADQIYIKERIEEIKLISEKVIQLFDFMNFIGEEKIKKIIINLDIEIEKELSEIYFNQIIFDDFTNTPLADVLQTFLFDLIHKNNNNFIKIIDELFAKCKILFPKYQQEFYTGLYFLNLEKYDPKSNKISDGIRLLDKNLDKFDLKYIAEIMLDLMLYEDLINFTLKKMESSNEEEKRNLAIDFLLNIFNSLYDVEYFRKRMPSSNKKFQNFFYKSIIKIQNQKDRELILIKLLKKCAESLVSIVNSFTIEWILSHSFIEGLKTIKSEAIDKYCEINCEFLNNLKYSHIIANFYFENQKYDPCFKICFYCAQREYTDLKSFEDYSSLDSYLPSYKYKISTHELPGFDSRFTDCNMAIVCNERMLENSNTSFLESEKNRILQQLNDSKRLYDYLNIVNSVYIELAPKINDLPKPLAEELKLKREALLRKIPSEIVLLDQFIVLYGLKMQKWNLYSYYSKFFNKLREPIDSCRNLIKEIIKDFANEPTKNYINKASNFFSDLYNNNITENHGPLKFTLDQVIEVIEEINSLHFQNLTQHSIQINLLNNNFEKYILDHNQLWLIKILISKYKINPFELFDTYFKLLLNDFLIKLTNDTILTERLAKRKLILEMVFRIIALLIYKRKAEKVNSQNNQDLEAKYKDDLVNLISMLKEKLIMYFNENFFELDQNTIEIINLLERKLFESNNNCSNENPNYEPSIVSFSNPINHNQNVKPFPAHSHLKSISSLNQMGLREPSQEPDEDIIRIINTYKLNPQNNNSNE